MRHSVFMCTTIAIRRPCNRKKSTMDQQLMLAIEAAGEQFTK